MAFNRAFKFCKLLVLCYVGFHSVDFFVKNRVLNALKVWAFLHFWNERPKASTLPESEEVEPILPVAEVMPPPKKRFCELRRLGVLDLGDI